ncbi:MAG TPA: class I SAM-dependent methyltransferase [Pyrinomonadaceae bacterium]|jgi:ubiquinone/menaquinone biosynthesis C-methylase UbiE|nr:class I SAM-dependent methyltransferase [Pyrinomonadaceae bacterium]
MSTVEADFDRLARLDQEGWTHNNHYHDSLLSCVPKDCENALEIGCGTGAFARELARRSKRVVALDLSPEMIRVARSHSSAFTNLTFELADAMTWNFQRSEFDFVCSIATLHHVPQREVFLKMRDALRPRGVMVVLDLVESNGLLERVLDGIALGVSPTLRLLRNGRLRPPAEVRKAWEEHGKHDSYATIDQMRALTDEILPGATVKRCLLWRYLLVYHKPATD